jgi:hypothetical protein
LSAIWRIDRGRELVNESVIDAVVRADRDRARTEGTESTAATEAEREQRIRGTPMGDSLPPFGRSFAAGDHLWLGDYPDPRRDTLGYTLIDEAGRIVGRLRLPREAHPAAFAHDRIILREEDDDGIVTFGIYRLRMPE